MAIKRSTCLTANRSRCFSLASERRMNDTQTVFHHFNFAVTIRLPWRRSSSPSLRSTRIRVAACRKFPLRISRFRYSTQATPAFSFPLPFLPSFYQLLRDIFIDLLELLEDRKIFESRCKTAIRWYLNLPKFSRPTNEPAWQRKLSHRLRRYGKETSWRKRIGTTLLLSNSGILHARGACVYNYQVLTFMPLIIGFVKWREWLRN